MRIISYSVSLQSVLRMTSHWLFQSTVLETSGQYSRTVNTGQVVGTVKPSIPGVGGTETTWIQVITDKSGSLVTTYPVPAPK